MVGFSAQDLANTAWSFATANKSGVVLMAVMARIAQRSMGGLRHIRSRQQSVVICNCVHGGCDSPGGGDEDNVAMGDVSAQDLANTAWAFATVCTADVTLFVVVMRIT